MADLHNPAGRLHELLKQFGTKQELDIRAAWAEVLDVSENEVALHIGDVASLLRDAQAAAKETGLDAFDSIPGHLQALSRSIFPVDVPFTKLASHVSPDPTAMDALKMLSAYLEKTAPEGQIPDAAEVEDLRSGFIDLVDAVTDADLPPDIRRVILHRLSDMIVALEHLNVGGPDAIRRAAEALAVSAMLYEDDAADDSGVFTRIRSAAKKTWVAFTITTTLVNAVVTFDRIADTGLLPPPQETRQLPAGPPTGEEDHGSDPRVEPS